jgi:hypothetical protein
MKAEDRTALNILTLPMPPRVDKEGRRLPASCEFLYREQSSSAAGLSLAKGQTRFRSSAKMFSGSANRPN